MTPRERFKIMFYILMRDHVQAGVLAHILFDHITPIEQGSQIPTFSNGHLAAYAEEIVDVLLEDAAR